MSAARILSALVVGSLLSLAGCDETWVDERARKVAFDCGAHAYTVVRTVRNEPVGGVAVEWTEEVKSAGDGRISVELLTRNGLARDAISDPVQLADFDRLAAQLATGGGYRAVFQRDPLPDDFDRLVANYWITVLDLSRRPVTARGEPALRYLIEPVSGDRPWYVLTASTKSGREGFPLASEEYVADADGEAHLVSRMEVTSLTWGAPSGFVANPQPVRQRAKLDTLDTARDHAAAVGLDLLLPKYEALPAGFVLALAEEVVVQSSANAAGVAQDMTVWRFVYSDGVEHIDFIEHAPLDTLPTAFRDSDYFELALVSHQGPISSASLLHRGTQITVESRIAAARFETMVQTLVRL